MTGRSPWRTSAGGGSTLPLAPVPIEYSSAVTVTASGTPHAKGAWSQIIASTSAAATGLIIMPSSSFTSSTDTRILLDIGIGAAASEVVKVADIPAGALNTFGPPLVLYVPLDLPAGTRIAARIQALIGSDTLSVVVAPTTSTGSAPTAPDTLGADTANSRGVNMPTSNTYVEVAAATSQAYRALIIVPGAGAGTTMDSETSVYTLAVGGAGSEVAIGSFAVITNSSETLAGNGPCPLIARDVPAGTRIACKQSTGRAYRDVVVIGVP